MERGGSRKLSQDGREEGKAKGWLTPSLAGRWVLASSLLPAKRIPRGFNASLRDCA